MAGSGDKESQDEVDDNKPQATLGVLGLQGHIDAIESGRVYGWAWNPEKQAERVGVDIYFKETLMGNVLADRFRQDLLDVKVGDGTHAFVFDLPANARNADPASISVYFSETQMPLSRGSRGELKAPGDTDDPVATLAGRMDRIEASLQQVFRAWHIIRRTDDAAPRVGGGGELENLHKAVKDIASAGDAIVDRVEKIEALTNASQSFIDRFDIEIHDRVTRREIDGIRDEIVSLRRLLRFGGLFLFIGISATVYGIIYG